MSSPFWCLVLFTRLDAAGLLEHAGRRRLVERLRASPGLTFSEAADALGVDVTTARYHARMLERAGRIVLVEDGRSRRLYLPGTARTAWPGERALRALLAVRGGARTPAALGRALGVPRGTAGSLLEAMERAGLVSRAEGRASLTEKGESCLPRGDGPAAS